MKSNHAEVRAWLGTVPLHPTRRFSHCLCVHKAHELCERPLPLPPPQTPSDVSNRPPSYQRWINPPAFIFAMRVGNKKHIDLAIDSNISVLFIHTASQSSFFSVSFFYWQHNLFVWFDRDIFTRKRFMVSMAVGHNCSPKCTTALSTASTLIVYTTWFLLCCLHVCLCVRCIAMIDAFLTASSLFIYLAASYLQPYVLPIGAKLKIIEFRVLSSQSFGVLETRITCKVKNQHRMWNQWPVKMKEYERLDL